MEKGSKSGDPLDAIVKDMEESEEKADKAVDNLVQAVEEGEKKERTKVKVINFDQLYELLRRKKKIKHLYGADNPQEIDGEELIEKIDEVRSDFEEKKKQIDLSYTTKKYDEANSPEAKRDFKALYNALAIAANKSTRDLPRDRNIRFAVGKFLMETVLPQPVMENILIKKLTKDSGAAPIEEVNPKGEDAPAEEAEPTEENLPVGTPVRTTTKALLGRGGSRWLPEAEAKRRWGVSGTIIAQLEGSEGTYYEVRHDDGTQGLYTRAELEVTNT